MLDRRPIVARPLPEVLRDTNKNSDNTLARTIFLSLGSLEADTLIRAEIPGWEQERRFYFDPEWNPGRQVLIHPCPGSVFRIDWEDIQVASSFNGIGGLVNVKTRKPFQLKPFVAQVSAEATYSELPKKTDPQFSGLVFIHAFWSFITNVAVQPMRFGPAAKFSATGRHSAFGRDRVEPMVAVARAGWSPILQSSRRWVRARASWPCAGARGRWAR